MLNKTSTATIAIIAALSAAGASLAVEGQPLAATSARIAGSVSHPSSVRVPKHVRIVAPSGPRAPIKLFTDAQYSTGGVSLRNRLTAGLNVSGVISPVQPQGAFLYWAVIVNAKSDPLAVQSLKLRRHFPLPDTGDVTLPGTLIGQGASPCWGGDHISVYKALVPNYIATGNGKYQVTIPTGGEGATDGSDPWVGTPVFPLWEGASLVMVGTGTRTVSIFDAGYISGKTFAASLSYSLPLFGPPTSGPVLWETWGADGQMGNSRSASAALSGEKTSINGLAVSGPGAPNSDSDWNGNSGSPLPQLWDDTGHDISTSYAVNGTKLDVKIESFGDCLTPVGNAIQF